MDRQIRLPPIERTCNRRWIVILVSLQRLVFIKREGKEGQLQNGVLIRTVIQGVIDFREKKGDSLKKALTVLTMSH
ncbi:MAG: hypothetical protein A3G93_01460 [Nitrospinae bacterium RIFCSPLOWO2_12_FULL_45_22]|nr:MAG: hypothetical protein A3G93_01460 [Nitrospinae bacterium RIFCSPLOWO2_12_FULL_45_22]